MTSRHYKVTHSDNKRSLFVQITIKSSSNTDSSDVISCLFRTTLGGLTTVDVEKLLQSKKASVPNPKRTQLKPEANFWFDVGPAALRK